MSKQKFQFPELTRDAHTAITDAYLAARLRHAPYVDVEHVLLGLLHSEEEPLKSIWEKIDREALIKEIGDELGMVREKPLEKVEGLTGDVETVLKNAGKQAQEMDFKVVNGGHLLLGIFEYEPMREKLHAAGLTRAVVREHVRDNSPKPTSVQQPIQIEFSRGNRRDVPTPRRPGERPVITIQPRSSGNTQIIFYFLAALTGLVIYLLITNPDDLISFGIVLGGWIFSLTLHEFSHALVAYWGGDYTVKEKGYLTFNPFKYTHPVLSIGLPILFLALGGLGLPGGAVYIEIHRLRSKYWRTAVALAGPASNAMLAVVLSLPFLLGIIEAPQDFGRWEAGLAALILLQVISVFLNLLPIPPLDGFNAISPYLAPEIVRSAYSLGFLSLFLVYYAFRIPAFNQAFYESVYQMLDYLHVPPYYASLGIQLFMFWRN